MEFKDGFNLKEINQNYFLAHDGMTQIIPEKYHVIVKSLLKGDTSEANIIAELIKSGMPETEAQLLDAEFIMKYSDNLE